MASFPQRGVYPSKLKGGTREGERKKRRKCHIAGSSDVLVCQVAKGLIVLTSFMSADTS